MRLTKRQILELIYEQQIADVDRPEDVKPEEDVWGTGEDLEDPIDYQEVSTGEAVESGVEVDEIVERLQLKLRLKRMIREMASDAPPVVDDMEAEVEVEPMPPADEEERAGASTGALRSWFSEKASEVNDLAISDPQVPALIAAMNDLIGQAQAGILASREDKVRKNIEA